MSQEIISTKTNNKELSEIQKHPLYLLAISGLLEDSDLEVDDIVNLLGNPITSPKVEVAIQDQINLLEHSE